MKTPRRTRAQNDLTSWLEGGQQPVLQRKGAPAPDSDPFKRHARSVGFAPPIDVEARLRAMRWKGPGDTSVHETQRAVTASLLERGWGVDDVVEKVLAATQAAVDQPWNWDREEHKIRKELCGGWYKKHPPKPEKKRKPIPRKPDIELVDDAQVDRRDDPEPTGTGGQVISMAAKKLEYDLKKVGKKATHVVLGPGLLADLAERGERIVYEVRSGGKHGNRACDYRDGLWELLSIEREHDWLATELQTGCEKLGITPTDRVLTETRKWLRHHADLQQRDIPWNKHGKIATRSGLLDPKTLTVEPLKAEHYATFRADCEYDPKAKCPWWKRMLKDCFEGDQATIDIVQEMAGASLLAEKPKEMTKALLLWGDTDTGKSNILIVLARLLSDDPITVSLDALVESFGAEPFERHAPWLLTEAFEQHAWHPSGKVKALLTGEAITINPKGSKRFSHAFRGPVFWGSNWPPQFKEASKAMMNRMRIIHCHAKFDDKHPIGAALEARKQKYNHPYELILNTEKPGVLNWALEGLHRLQERGYLEETEEMAEAAREMRAESNYVAGFFADGHAELDENMMVGSPDLCAAITMWHSAKYGEDRRLLSNHLIGKQINVAFDRDLVSYKNDGRNYYVGVRLTDSGLRLWQGINDVLGSRPPGKHWSCAENSEVVNRVSPVSRKQALALRVQRRSADAVRDKKRKRLSAGRN